MWILMTLAVSTVFGVILRKLKMPGGIFTGVCGAKATIRTDWAQTHVPEGSSPSAPAKDADHTTVWSAFL